MKPIKIRINRLGAIADTEVTVRPFMLFSGESGLGKSYVAMLIHYIYRLILEDRTAGFFTQENITLESLTSKDSGTLLISTKDFSEWADQDAANYMREATGNPRLPVDVHIDIPFKSETVTISYERELIGLAGKETLYATLSIEDSLPIGNLLYRFPLDMKELESLPLRRLFGTWLELSVFGSSDLNEACLLIPGRGALLSAPGIVQEDLAKSSGMVSEFLKDWMIIRDMPPQKDIDKPLQDRICKINGGCISIREDKSVEYAISEAETIPVSASASSVKELAPLAVLLDKYPASGLSILFEEPEAHLHPNKQMMVADLVVEMVGKGSHLQITTHSDYFLRRVNDRITLYKLKEKDPKRHMEVCRKYGYTDSVLDPDTVGAYLLKKRSDKTVELREQKIDSEGVPYESFYEVIENDVVHSMDIIRELNAADHVGDAV